MYVELYNTVSISETCLFDKTKAWQGEQMDESNLD
jgi:hypothetical protein